MLYLVRHAHAGDRRSWEDDDELRPLSERGWRQATAIAERLEKHQPGALLSSWYVRCRQTLEPLAQRLVADIVDHDALVEGADVADTIALLRGSTDGTVCCTHGDVLPATIDALRRRGMRVKGDDWRKATVWSLTREGDRFTTASVWRPDT